MAERMPNRWAYRVTSFCLVLASLCFFVPYAVILLSVALNPGASPFMNLSPSAFLMSLGLSFVLLGVAVIGIYRLTQDYSKRHRAIAAVGVFGCSAIVTALLMDHVGVFSVDELIGNIGFSAVGLWMILLNVYTWRSRIWPRPLSALGVFAGIPLAMFPIVAYRNIEAMFPLIVGPPPIWLVALAGFLILRDVQGRPLDTIDPETPVQ